MPFFRSVILGVCVCFSAGAALAQDIVRVMPPEAEYDIRYDYKRRVLEAALEASEARYGSYAMLPMPGVLSYPRAWREMMKSNGLINTMFAIPTEEREADAIPVRIPIRKGLLNYRLLLIRKADQEKFQKIQTVEDLDAFTLGAGVTWITTRVFRSRGVRVATNENRLGLFNMLDRERFDYILLGVNEVFKEIEKNKLDARGMMVAPGIAVYIDMPLYIFVSRRNPELAERIEVGLNELIRSGEFDTLFEDEYMQYIHRAELNKRHIIRIENPFLPKTVPLSNKAYWLDISKPKYTAP